MKKNVNPLVATSRALQ